MSRISREQMFLDIAEIVAKRSTCLRNNVGAIIVNNNNIISIGYNGVASGCTHCTTETCIGKGCSIALHAEHNAITRVKEKPNNKCSLYTTVMPCGLCAKEIVDCGYIDKVYYRYPYRDDTGVKYLLYNFIEVYKVLPSGEIIKGWGQWKGK